LSWRAPAGRRPGRYDPAERHRRSAFELALAVVVQLKLGCESRPQGPDRGAERLLAG
jgi:hypothetical protein